MRGSDFIFNLVKLINVVENVKIHRDMKLVKTVRRRNYLVSKPNYHTKKVFTKNLLATEMKRAQIIMNKPVYLGFPILDISISKMYEFGYDYLIPKYYEKVKRCHMAPDSYIGEEVASRFDTSNDEVNRPLPIGKS